VGSKVSFVLDSTAFEFLPDAMEYARRGFIPGGLKRNMDFISDFVDFADSVKDEIRNLLFDPQTSGGLLLAVSSNDAAPLLEALRANGVGGRLVGEVIEKIHPLLQVR
jgi:selenide, water dikinase